MIISQTEDADWRAYFTAVPPLMLPQGPVLLLAPHPDDETLGAGAVIATLTERGVPVTIVAATDGENAYESSLEERRALAVERAREQHRALEQLGVPQSGVTRLRLVDSGLATQEDELVNHLLQLVQPGTTLVAPWIGDFHPDHEACARAAHAVAAERSLQLISYFFWTWHRGRPDILHGLPLRRFDPAPAALAAKSAALAMHMSQLHHDYGEPILPERLLGPARWPFEVFLQA